MKKTIVTYLGNEYDLVLYQDGSFRVSRGLEDAFWGTWDPMRVSTYRMSADIGGSLRKIISDGLISLSDPTTRRPCAAQKRTS